MFSVETDSQRLRRIAEEANNRTVAEAMYAQFVERAEMAAKHGLKTIGTQFIKKNVFMMMFDQAKAMGDTKCATADEFCEEQYNAQYEFADMLTKNGFKVDIHKNSGIILAGEANDPNNQNVDADVTVEW